jgi:hypothetical protein
MVEQRSLAAILYALSVVVHTTAYAASAVLGILEILPMILSAVTQMQRALLFLLCHL